MVLGVLGGRVMEEALPLCGGYCGRAWREESFVAAPPPGDFYSYSSLASRVAGGIFVSH